MPSTYRNFEIKPCREEYQKGSFYFSHGACNYTPGAGCFESERLTRKAIDAWYLAGGKSPVEDVLQSCRGVAAPSYYRKDRSHIRILPELASNF